MNATTPQYRNEIRESRPELFRLVLMFGIVFYHVLLHAVPGSDGIAGLDAVRTLLHVAVPCFVLLSGWYGIKPSARGFIRLWTMCVFYGIPLLAVALAAGWRSFGPRLAGAAFLPLFFSLEWWFVVCYAALYLSAPVLNVFVENSTSRRIWLAAAALFFLSFYVGHGPYNRAFAAGKNLCHFMFLYLVGNRLRALPPDVGRALSSRRLFFAAVVVMAAACGLGSLHPLEHRLYAELFFVYNSPFLNVLAALAFLSFLQPFRRDVKAAAWRNRTVNALSASVFPVYLLHENDFISPTAYPALKRLVFAGLPPLQALLAAFAVAVAIFAAALALDAVLRPLRSRLASFLASVFSRTVSAFASICPRPVR